MITAVPRTLSWDWYPGSIPDNVDVADDAYIETTFSFVLFRSKLAGGVRVGKAASTYLGTMFDVGPSGRVTLGDFALVHGARIICDRSVNIGDHCLISWNVVVMDTHRAPRGPAARVEMLRRFAGRGQDLCDTDVAHPVRIESNVWIGFDSCIMPGVTVGEGSIIGARSVVSEDIPPYSIAVGNPARVIRAIARDQAAETLARARSHTGGERK
jgi:acetyltransferase-like isoleucine patch superfamily enzyme